jgi:hypothetical protein
VKRITTIAGIAIAALSAAAAHATVLLDTGPGPATAMGYGVYGTNSPYGQGQYFQSLAGEFTTGKSWTIDSVQGWMAAEGPAFNFPSGPVDLNVSIYSNAPANPGVNEGYGQPGSAIFTASFALTLCANGSQESCPVGWQGATGLDWSLKPGTYWVVFEGTGSDTGWAGMAGPVAHPLENSLFLDNGQDWGELNVGGFGVEISGVGQTSGVPEPATASLLFAGLLGLAMRFRHRRDAALRYP